MVVREKMNMILLILFLILSLLLTSCVSTQTTFQEDILDKLENYNIHELGMYVFRDSAEKLKYRTTATTDEINNFIEYLNTFSLQEIKDINNNRLYDKYMIVLSYLDKDDTERNEYLILITIQNYENLHVTLELPNNKAIKKNYKILDGEVDSDYLEELYEVHLNE